MNMNDLTITQVGRFLIVVGKIPATEVEALRRFMSEEFSAVSDPFDWVWVQDPHDYPHAVEAEFIQL